MGWLGMAEVKKNLKTYNYDCDITDNDDDDDDEPSYIVFVAMMKATHHTVSSASSH